MNYEIRDRPSYAILEVKLAPGETIRAEAGAMTYMTPNIEVNTKMRETSFWETLGLKVLGAQSFFVNEYTAVGAEGTIGLVAAPVGDMTRLAVEPGAGYVIQKASYVASTPGVELDIKWEGFSRGLFGQGLFMIKVSGKGDLFINTFGAIEQRNLAAGEEWIVDNFHLVAFSDSCSYSVTKFGSLKSTILGGEGLVVRLKGPGQSYIQTKNPGEFTEWIWSLIEPRVRGRAR